MSTHIFGFELGLDRVIFGGLSHADPLPQIYVDGVSEQRTSRRMVGCQAQSVKLIKLRGRHCTGFFDLESYASFPCPQFVRLESPRHTQCFECRERSGFNPSFYNVPRSQLSAKQRKYNERPHAVYLAAFGPEIVKVGISSQDRLPVRLREQGALAARIVARKDNAYAAREIESEISQHGLVRDQIGNGVKIAYLVQGSDIQGCEEAIERLAYCLVQQGVISLSSGREECGRILEANRATASKAEGAIDISNARPLAVAGSVVGAVGRNLLIASDLGKSVLLSAASLAAHRIGCTDTTIWSIPASQRLLL